MGYPLPNHRVNVKHDVAALALVQGTFRDTYPASILENPGACESSQRAALVGDTLIRTAGILELSLSQKVDRGPEEGHGHGIYVIIVLIDSSKSDAKLMQTSFHETE